MFPFLISVAILISIFPINAFSLVSVFPFSVLNSYCLFVTLLIFYLNF